MLQLDMEMNLENTKKEKSILRNLMQEMIWELRVLEVFKTKAKDLKEYGIRMSTINKLKREHRGFVELIRFETL